MIALLENLLLLALLLLFLLHVWLYSLRWFENVNSEETGIPRRLQDALRKPDRWSSFLLEYFYHLASLALTAADAVRILILRLANTPPPPIPRSEDEALCTPVILVPGYMMGIFAFYPLKMWLRRQGLNPVVPVAFSPPWGDLETMAEQLREKVDEVYEACGRTRVILIAHSLGGLVSRFYLTKLEGSSFVKKVIYLATPHRGTKLWTFALGPCAAQMRPGSPFLLSLNAAPPEAVRVPQISLYSDFDEMVIPAASAKLERGGGVNVPLAAVGHNAYLYSPKVYRRILEAVEPSAAGRPFDSGPLF